MAVERLDRRTHILAYNPPIWPITQERGIQGEKTKPFRERKGFTGVANAARTRDLLNHNQMLYQLSYGHHSAVFSKLNSRNR